MKKIFWIVISLITCNCFSQIDNKNSVENSLIGKWCGTDYSEHSGCTILDDKGFVTFTSKDRTFGGENYQYGDKNYIYKYIIDYSNSPILLDFIVYVKGIEKEEKHFKSIVRFLDKNTIEMRTGEKKYPKRFSSKKDKRTIILKRVE
ncbi:MAG: hypothetical protein ABIQ27_12165 [Flavobacterium sp.]|uniref:hypothetical protein n=1 Tax=Flavobacterium sp. TaxID=239 RepID=UPI00326664A8